MNASKTDETVVTDESAQTDESAEAVEGLDERDREPADADETYAGEADEADDAVPAPAAGVGAGAAGVVSAALGLAALTGTWMGKVASERETLIGQIKAQGGTPAQQISEIYGDAWHATALVNGVFAVLALITAVVVLTRPERPAWVRAVAVAGAVLGGIGLFLSAGMYFDLFLSLPTAG
ncbi:hypothetical protein ACIGBL_24735 [Streptomyces sp. NPDC085614]|uniref:hypothetical protein n=1 Tax=Streptomyces sp. NPDC085614 TaxID=3365733 RepID=UPI0037CD1311